MSVISSSRSVPSRRATGCFRAVIFVVALHPIHDLSFVATLWRDVEIDENGIHLLVAARVTRIRVKDRSGVILDENAQAPKLVESVLDHLIVVIDLALRQIIFGKRYVVVVVEIVAIG